jgi:ABC-2 type transport system ATP-binding protein
VHRSRPARDSAGSGHGDPSRIATAAKAIVVRLTTSREVSRESKAPMLEAQHLVKRFFGVTVVNDINLTVDPGEIVGYLGPNGSGKTTTVRMLTGLLDPTSGHVLFEGRDITSDPVVFRRHLGYVPEEPHLYPFLSGREYLELVGRLRQVPDALLERKINSLLELFGLAAAADQNIAAYSKGMKQRILIMAALLHDPDVLIFDEPDSGLDVTTMLVLRHLVKRLAERGKAILYSSHVLEVVEKVCTRVIVLHRGRTVADGSVAQLRSLMVSGSLEEVFAQLVLRDDPERTAQDIADVMAVHA